MKVGFDEVIMNVTFTTNYGRYFTAGKSSKEEEIVTPKSAHPER